MKKQEIGLSAVTLEKEMALLFPALPLGMQKAILNLARETSRAWVEKQQSTGEKKGGTHDESWK